MPDARPPRTRPRLDSSKIENALTGLGIPGQDQAEANVRRHRVYTTAQARSEYRGSFAARREIDRPAEDIIARGIEFVDMPAWVNIDAVKAYLADVGAEGMLPEDRGVLKALSLLQGTSMKLGGAIGVMIIEDGLEPWEPVDFSRIDDLVAIEILERDEVSPWSPDGSTRPEFYVLGSTRGAAHPSAIVHRSRVIVGVGDRLGPREEALNQGWGASRLELLQGERTAMHVGFQELASVALKSTIDVLGIAELNEMLCSDGTGDTGRTSVEERIALIARARSQHKVVPIDAGREPNAERKEPGRPADTFTSVARNTRGAQDLAIANADHWAGATGQTPSIALGKTVGVFNSGENAGDWASWGSVIDGIQTIWLHPRVRIALDVIFAARNGPTRGRVPTGWTLESPPLAQPSQLEEAQTASAWAKVDTAYVLMDGALAGPIIEQRLVQGVTGAIRLDPEPVVEPGEELEGDPEVIEDEDVDELEQAWSDAQPPADAGTAVELANHDDLANKISAQGIHALRASGEIEAYKDIRKGQLVPVFSLREVKAALLLRREPVEVEVELEEDLDDGARADSKPRRRWFARWRR